MTGEAENLDAELDAAYEKMVADTSETPEISENPEVSETPEPEKSVKETHPEAGTDDKKTVVKSEDEEPAKKDAKKDVSEAAKTLAAAKKAAKEEAAKEPATEEMLLPPGLDGQVRKIDPRVAPSSWRKEAAAKFAELPPEIRQEIHKREDDMHRGLANYKSAAEYARTVAQEFEPYRAFLHGQGLNEVGVIRDLMSTAWQLQSGSPQQKAALMLQIGAKYGVDWNTAAQIAQQGGVPQQSQQGYDPRVDQLIQQNAAREQAENQRIAYEAQNEASQFFSDPKNEFAAIVREDMARLIESGQANDLPTAYDKAVWSNPVVRQTLMARQAEDEARKAAEKAAAAKQASSVNIPRRATPAGGAAPKSTLNDELSEAYDRLLG